MTLRQAVAQATEELGWPEEKINAAIAYADDMCPGAAETQTTIVIPEGKERAVIDILKERYKPKP